MAMQREDAVESIAAIDRLSHWVHKNPRWAADVVLVGGWAVHSWAPYYFSVDIDLVVRKDARDALKKELPGWKFYPANPRASEDKSKWQRDTPSGVPVILDIAGTGPRMSNEFARDRRRSIPWKEAIDHSSVRPIPWADPPMAPALRVCDLDLLFLYKLKALDDRTFRLRNEPDATGYLAQKRVKDAKDIWALLQVLRGQPELTLIRRYLDEHPFLRATLRGAPDIRAVTDEPDQGSAADYRELAETLLSSL